MHLHLPDEVYAIMGHTRMATQGSEKLNFNNHPFPGRAGDQHFALAHNGVISNDKLLQKEKSLPESYIQTDSYIAVQLLENAGHLDFNSVREMAEDLIGSFVFTILDDSDGIYFVRGNNPLTIYNFHTHGFYLYASTRDILDKTLRKIGMSRATKTEVKTNLGDILRIDSDGNIERSEFFAYNDYSAFYAFPRKTPWDNYYINQLKEIASCFGVDPQYVDLLYENGFSADEIEELLYEPEELMNYADVLEYEGLYF
ncbi:MAG TPA: glucosamine 6-phosphate synthetase [Ruminococcaceae bacterium]|nr:glucosamine 6-phosphate synthetase [Oscillospiraceae bacterium]